MERLCRNCNSLVTGNGEFCPTCGGVLSSHFVNLDKGADAMPNGGQSQPMNNQAQYGNNGYSNNNNHTAPYGYGGGPYNAPAPMPMQPVQQVMTLGQWVGTILLTSMLGIISIILLFVWGFSNDTPEPKKTYCRAMLVVQAISVGLVLIYMLFMGAYFASLLSALT